MAGLSPERSVLATRLVFLMNGIAMAAWAPLVPLAKARLGLDEGSLGLLLLFLGIGSVVAMPLTGVLVARLGCRIVILTGGVAITIALPLLALLDTWAGMAVAIGLFGATLGAVDVTMNIQAVMVERKAKRSLMSGFHGMFSIGGIIGAGGVSLLLGVFSEPWQAATVVAVIALVLLLAAGPALLPYGNDSGESTPLFVFPKGIILFIGLLCLFVFLAEGAILDWSAVYLISHTGASVATAGLGYAVFSVAMTIGRLTGDRLRSKFSDQVMLFSGGLVAAAGFMLAVLVPTTLMGLIGFMLVGLGAANAVPVLFSAAGRTKLMPSNLAVASVATLAYTGVLVGPALIGFVSQWTSLAVALSLVAASLVFVAFNSRVVTR